MSGTLKYLSFCILILIMGFVAGALCWALLQAMNLGISFVWDKLPVMLGTESSLIYNLAVCLTGGLIIGLMQKKCGVLPDSMELIPYTL